MEFDTNFQEDLPLLSSTLFSNQTPLKLQEYPMNNVFPLDYQSSSSKPLMFQNSNFDKLINLVPPNGSNLNPSQSFVHFSATTDGSSSIPFTGIPIQSIDPFGSDYITQNNLMHGFRSSTRNYLWDYISPQAINQTQQPNANYHIYPPPLSSNFQGFGLPTVVNGLPTDDVSCITKSGQIKRRRAIKKGGKSSKKINIIKGQWTLQEDNVLLKLVECYGEKKWAQIANMMKGRIGKQCRERWHNHLRPHIRKDTWSEEEEKMLIEAHKEMGNKWAEIARRLPGRTENTIKNHWNAAKRKQISRNKNNKDFSNNSTQVGSSSSSSLLQNYIRSLMIINSSTSITYTTTSTNTNPPSHHHHHEYYNNVEMNNITNNTGLLDSSNVSYSGDHQWEAPLLFNTIDHNEAANIGVISNHDESYGFRSLLDQELIMPSAGTCGIYDESSTMDFEIENQVNQGMDLLMEMIISQGNSKF